MTDVLVSIRMPESLHFQLHELVDERHFLDLSEEIRSIVRNKWMNATKPELAEMKRLRSNIEKELQTTAQRKVQEEVNKELRMIRDQLRKGGILNEK